MAFDLSDHIFCSMRSSDIVQTMAGIRDSAEGSEDRRRRREYLRYVARAKAIEELFIFSYAPSDYKLEMVPREFAPPETPDYSHLVPEAQAEAEAKYRYNFGPLLLAAGIGIFIDFLLLGPFRGFLSLLIIVFTGYETYKKLKIRRQVIQKAIEAAGIRQEELLREFHEQVERDREEFEQAEVERIAEIQQIIDGAAAASIEVVRRATGLVVSPFVMPGNAELYGQELILNFDMPEDDFVPVAEWAVDEKDSYRKSERSPTGINRIYIEAVAGCMVQSALRVLERLPAMDSVSVNGFRKEGDRKICLVGAAIARENLKEICSGKKPLEVVDAFGTMRASTSYSLSEVEPVLPAWVGTAIAREIHRCHFYCTYEVPR